MNVVACVLAVGALVYLVVSAVPMTRCDSMMPSVLMSVIDIIAHNVTAVQTDTFFSMFASHEGRVYPSDFLLIVCVQEWFAVVVTSRHFSLAVGALNDLLVVTVLTHLVLHVCTLELCMADNTVV